MTTADGESTGSEVIRAEGIRKGYRTFDPMPDMIEVLTGADVTLHAGEIVGIVGENGSGKSTLMKTLVGILDHDDGTIERNGEIGWCPQELLVYDRLTVSEMFDLFGEGYGMTDSEVDEARQRLADQLEFREYLDYRIENLSGGNKQKVNLSMALMHQPDLLLLDEPYTGFDWETYQAFWEISETLVEQGTGIAIISHLLNERERFDRIYELNDGKLTDITDADTAVPGADDAGANGGLSRQGVTGDGD